MVVKLCYIHVQWGFAMISLKNVTKTFTNNHSSFSALKGVDVSIKKGEFVVSIVGKSGSGKSTLINYKKEKRLS
jgi:ABC-type lipoprotein export system ATPase subunit